MRLIWRSCLIAAGFGLLFLLIRGPVVITTHADRCSGQPRFEPDSQYYEPGDDMPPCYDNCYVEYFACLLDCQYWSSKCTTSSAEPEFWDCHCKELLDSCKAACTDETGAPRELSDTCFREVPR